VSLCSSALVICCAFASQYRPNVESFCTTGNVGLRSVLCVAGSHVFSEEAMEALHLRRRMRKYTRPMMRAIPTVPPATVPAMAVVLNADPELLLLKGVDVV